MVSPSSLFDQPKPALQTAGFPVAIARIEDCVIPSGRAGQDLACVPGRRSRVQDNTLSTGPQVRTGKQAGVETPDKWPLKGGRRDSKAHSFVIAAGTIEHASRKTMRGQLGRKKYMVQTSFIVLGGVLEREVVFSGTGQGAVKEGGKGRSEIEPTVGPEQRRGPVARRVRAAVPVTSDKREPHRVKSRRGDSAKELKASRTGARGVHVRNCESATTNRHLRADHSVAMRKSVREKSV